MDYLTGLLDLADAEATGEAEATLEAAMAVPLDFTVNWRN